MWHKLQTCASRGNAFNYVYPNQSNELVLDLIKLITFDAIIGNNDRHFYNWGVIGYVESNNCQKVEFAPIYDTARGLLWNVVEKKVKYMHDQDKKGSKDQIYAFLERSRPRFSYANNGNANHFELIKFLANRNNTYKETIAALVTENLENLAIMKLISSISCYTSSERMFLMTKILKLRFKALREIIYA